MHAHRPFVYPLAVLLCLELVTGCSSGEPGDGKSAGTPSGGYSDAINSLPYLGEGAKAEYQQRYAEAADDVTRKKVVDQATQVSSVVGTKLAFAEDLAMSGSTIQLNEDGTVTASDDLARAYMSGAYYWQVGDRTFELCPDKDCTYSASWRVEAASAPHSKHAYGHFVFILQANGKDTEVERAFALAP